MDTYYRSKARHKPSGDVVLHAMRHVLEVLGDIDVAAFDADRQLELVESLRMQGLADGTIKCRIDRILAGCRWYARRRDSGLWIPPKIRAGEDWELAEPGRKRPFTLEQLAALLNAGADREHYWRFMMLAIGTASRPTALLELTWPQLEDGLVYLQPEGRKKTKKRRATVPMAPTLARDVATWTQDSRHVISSEGLPFGGRTFFAPLARLAGVRGTASVVRHTVRTWVAKQGVQDAQGDTLMGHRTEGSRTGDFYKHLSPNYISDAVAAIERLYQELVPLVPRLAADKEPAA